MKSKKLYIYFSEYIKLTNASEKVIVSPPQMEQPEITSQGKRIAIKLADSLRANTTHTGDFSARRRSDLTAKTSHHQQSKRQ